MVYLLSEIRESRCISESIIIWFHFTEPQIVVLAKLKKLEFYQIHISNDTSSLELIDVLYIEEPVLALSKLNSGNKEWLIVLTESQKISVIGHKNGTFIRRADLQFNTKGHQRTIDSNISITSPKNDSGFFIVHNFQGFVQLVIMNQKSLNEPECRKQYKKRLLKEDLWKIKTLALGNIVVQKMVLLEGKKNTLAVLYRDFNYNYSMRFYSVDLEIAELTMIKQFNEFDIPPTDIIALRSGGILVLSSTHIFYFPDPSIKHLSILNDITDKSLTINMNEKVVTKIIFDHIESELHELVFTNHAIIDDSRILIVTSTGLSFLLYFSVEILGDSISVNNIRIIKMGSTTISNSLHYISNGIFFASSNLSQSILFNICPQSPFINICQFIPSSPPILDIDVKYKTENIKVLTCQGGYNSGEFRSIESSSYNLRYLKDLEVSESTSISVYKNSSVIEVNKKVGVGSRYSCTFNNDCLVIDTLESREISLSKSEELLLNLQNLNMSNNGSALDVSVEMHMHITLDNGSFLYVSKSNEIHFYDADSNHHSFNLSQEVEVSDIDLIHIKDGTYIALLSFWNSGFSVYFISKFSCKLICNETSIGNTSGIYSGKLFYERKLCKSDFWILLSTSNGFFLQYNFSLLSNKKIDYKDSIIQYNSFPLKIVKSSTNDIILYNKSHIIGMVYNPIINYFKLSNILNTHGIEDVKFVNEKILALFLNNNFLRFYELVGEGKPEQDKTSFSNLLNLKSIHIPDSNFSILLSIDKRFNIENGEIQKYSCLRLMDNQAMKIINVYEFPSNEEVDLTSLAYIPSGIDPRIPMNTFVALSNSSKKDSILLMFSIKKNKIIPLNKVEVSGLMDVEQLSFMDIIPLHPEEFSYFIFGNVNFIVHLEFLLEKSLWKVHPESAFQLPTTAISASSINERIFIGDMLKGIYKVKLTRNSIGEYISNVSKITPEYEASYLTSLALKDSDDDNDELVFSDSLGNISTLIMHKNSEKYVQTSAFNIGEQINVVRPIPDVEDFKQDFHSLFNSIPNNTLIRPLVLIGTVTGAIYSLSRVDEEDIEEVLSKCIKELMAYTDTFADISSKSKKLTYLKARFNWKSLKSDDYTDDPNKESFGIIDLHLIRRWLEYDFSIRQKQCDNVEANSVSKRNELKTCYVNKKLLEKIIYESEI